MSKQNLNQQPTPSDTSNCLKHISSGKSVAIAATDGTETLAVAHDVFSYIDPAFENLGCNKIEQPTPEVAVEVYEQIEDANYHNIFGSIDSNPDHLVLTTSQIKSFVVNNTKDFLLNGEEWTCFRFLFKAGSEFFVADVRILANGEHAVRITRFVDESVRHAQYHHRIVVPRHDIL
jgi:hypothetical protein